MQSRTIHQRRLLRIYLFIAFVYFIGATKPVTVEELVSKWAPIIWIHPEEEYFPLSVSEFLENVYPVSENGKREKSIPMGNFSERTFLYTKANIDALVQNKSFLNGQNPKEHSVPIYAIITNCRPKYSYYFHVTYWIFYPFNRGKEFCIYGRIPTPLFFNKCLGRRSYVGNHVGDWEHVSMIFNGKYYPEEIFVSTHDSGVYYKYDKEKYIYRYKKQITLRGIVEKPNFPKLLKTVSNRPVLFSALGSHGLWSSPGEHVYTRVLKITDKTAFGTPWKTWENISIYNAGKEKPPLWLNFLGKWGNPKSNCYFPNKLGLCEYTDGPPGLLRRRKDFQCAITGSPRDNRQ